MPKDMMLVSQVIGGSTNIYAFWRAACESGGLTGLLALKNVEDPVSVGNLPRSSPEPAFRCQGFADWVRHGVQGQAVDQNK
jgi:hypothetical protein